MTRLATARTARQLARLQDLDLLAAALQGAGGSSPRSASRPCAAALAEIELARTSVLSELPVPWLNHYVRLSGRYGRAVVPVVDHACVGCHMRVPVGSRPVAAIRPAITRCESCGRLLFWPPHAASPPVPGR